MQPPGHSSNRKTEATPNHRSERWPGGRFDASRKSRRSVRFSVDCAEPGGLRGDTKAKAGRIIILACLVGGPASVWAEISGDLPGKTWPRLASAARRSLRDRCNRSARNGPCETAVDHPPGAWIRSARAPCFRRLEADRSEANPDLLIWLLSLVSTARTLTFACLLFGASAAAAGSGTASSPNRSATSDVDLIAFDGTARDWATIVVHHSATASGSVESFDRFHRSKGWDGIGYHFVIGNGDGMVDGAVEPTFRWRLQREGAHAAVSSYNEQGIGICLVGNFDVARPTPAQVASFDRLVARLRSRFPDLVERPVPHGRLTQTACPGRLFPSDRLLPPASSLPLAIDATGRMFCPSLPQVAERPVMSLPATPPLATPPRMDP